MNKFICKCGCSNMIIEYKGSQRGMYCKSCGKWQKWATKEDERVISYKTKILKRGE